MAKYMESTGVPLFQSHWCILVGSRIVKEYASLKRSTRMIDFVELEHGTLESGSTHSRRKPDRL
jgi:hypothetical protein